ncbi:MAG: MBL fold metallo-hydrolase [Candidatus Heimdallarchaeota archaeon]|nr:MBL fold metallo-hydrolase [Candidatus Heimdallarchaeota archaeon]MCK4255008.1 MBL fold metallo-hydrolase [Candidatus Heimdallarchaeota archaeon]
MKITIVYDNTSLKPDLEANWGFACYIETSGTNILFDTGTRSSILLDNMKKLNVNPAEADIVFISHKHADHMGGLLTIMELNKNARIYVPVQLAESLDDGRLYKLDQATAITKTIISSGLLESEGRKGLLEQSLFIETKKGMIVVVGCSHSGVKQILEKCQEFGKPHAIVGGLHGFSEFELLENLEAVCPTHCTKHINKIKNQYPNKYIKGGVGAIINF